MSIFDDIVSFFSGGSSRTELEDRTEGSPTGTQTRGTSPRPRPAPSPIARTASNIGRSIMNDIRMGTSTFGQTGEQQAETLREAGYSEDVISDYQARTEATKERARQEEAAAAERRAQDADDRQARREEAKGTRPEPVAETAAEPQDVGVPKGERPDGAAVADAEQAGRRGRRATIGTMPRGLTTEPETAARRSLMGLVR